MPSPAEIRDSPPEDTGALGFIGRYRSLPPHAPAPHGDICHNGRDDDRPRHAFSPPMATAWCRARVEARRQVGMRRRWPAYTAVAFSKLLLVIVQRACVHGHTLMEDCRQYCAIMLRGAYCPHDSSPESGRHSSFSADDAAQSPLPAVIGACNSCRFATLPISMLAATATKRLEMPCRYRQRRLPALTPPHMALDGRMPPIRAGCLSLREREPGHTAISPA